MSNSRAIVTTIKFVGVFSVGLLTGSSLSQCVLTAPALLRASSPVSASRAFDVLRTSPFHSILAATSFSSMLLAYILSPRSQRHPYLIWSSLAIGATTVFLGGSERNFLAQRLGWKDSESNDYEVMRGVEEDMAEGINGEVVKAKLEDWGHGLGLRSAGYGLAWAMATIGLWGDGYGTST